MTQPLSTPEQERLYIQGDRLLHQEQYPAAVATLEQLLPTVDPANQRLWFATQRSLVKAYQHNQQSEQAISLCQKLADSEEQAIALWGQNFLTTLAPELATLTQQLPEIEEQPTNPVIHPTIKPKSLAQFRQYCEDNLLGYLQELERQRKIALRSIFGSALVCLILVGCVVLLLSQWIRWHNLSPLMLSLLALLFPGWLIFYRSCIQAYGMGFKRNLIEKIIDFIDDHNCLDYAPQLFIEDKRQTIIALTRSQILRDELYEPEELDQEDCVYGNIGDTDIFFAEIFVRKVRGGHLNELGQKSYLSKSQLFQGLFFEAKFAKQFRSRTFILPNDLPGQLGVLNNWRGETVQLEDPEFNRLFKVYGDNQIESRYLLSTNLISRLVDFRRQANRDVLLSFVDGFLYIAIPYQHNLFEPKLWQSMMSFAPLKEYFQILQLMMGTVESLKLNRRIWG